MITTLINEHLINLDLKATRKEEVFTEMARLLVAQGKVSDEQQFVKDLWAREELDNTGFEEGVALPHAKSAAVSTPAVAIGISRYGIDYGAEDGKPSKLFFMIASPAGGANHHIEVLAELSAKLIEEGFIDALLAAKTPADALALLLAKKEEAAAAPAANKGLIIGVTGCPAGIAHTYLAAESLERAAKELGYEVKVETNGSIGVKNSPTADEIARAAAIVVACDKQVDMARFAGKPLIKTGVKAPIKDGKGLIEQALKAPAYVADKDEKKGDEKRASGGSSDLYRYLMNGVSHMIPFVVTGGLLIALSLAIGGNPTPSGMQIPEGSMWNQILNVGVAAFTLMIPILAGYIAYAIG
ncbi:MAG: fructose PTS transporter subunit IIA, partial [Aeromonas sp.]